MKSFRARILNSYKGLNIVGCGNGTYFITGKRGDWVATKSCGKVEVAKSSTKNGALYAIQDYHNAL